MKIYVMLILYAIIFLLSISNSGCVSQSVLMQKAELHYLKDIKFEVESNGIKTTFNGSGVVEPAPKMTITVFPKDDADLISITSCHREMRIENPDKNFFDKGYKFEISPVDGLESGRSCPIEIGVYEKRKGRYQWAFLAIKNKKFQMPADVKCNGAVKKTVGTSVCQSRTILVQEYYFDRVVEAVFEDKCKLKNNSGQRFTFQIPSGPCTVYFIDALNSQNIHQANLFGYDEILLKD